MNPPTPVVLKTKKRTAAPLRPVNPAFHPDNEATDDAEVDPANPPEVKRAHLVQLEDPQTRFKRLKLEGAQLCEIERFWQAIQLFDRALEIRADDAGVRDMKAQALIALHEWEPAIHEALRVVAIEPGWWEAHQTLGRAFLGWGSLVEARRSFSRALHINPADKELREEDLAWTLELLKRDEERKKAAVEQDADPDGSHPEPLRGVPAADPPLPEHR